MLRIFSNTTGEKTFPLYYNSLFLLNLNLPPNCCKYNVVGKQKLKIATDELPEYFYVVFKSTGYNREVLSTEVLYTSKIDTNTIRW